MIYTSVTSGTIASKKELDQYFPDKSKEEIIKTILEKGDLQLGDKERSA
jgi:ribosome maturation protein SDO1